MEIRIKKLRPDAIIPNKAHDDDFCYDCYAISEEEVAPNVWRYGFGFALQIDRDDQLDHLRNEIKLCIDGRPRSSVWKTGMVLANCTATIDEGYTGEVMAVFYHVMPSMPRYKVGDKILQISLNVGEPLYFREVEELEKTSRGSGGFGSTDKKLFNMVEIKSLKDLVDLFEEMYGDSPKQDCKHECKHKCEKQECDNTQKINTNVELSKDVFMVDENSYLLSKKVNGTKTSENEEIIFDHTENGVVVPGITEEQILCMLLYRNRNNKNRYDLIKQLLNTI